MLSCGYPTPSQASTLQGRLVTGGGLAACSCTAGGVGPECTIVVWVSHRAAGCRHALIQPERPELAASVVRGLHRGQGCEEWEGLRWLASVNVKTCGQKLVKSTVGKKVAALLAIGSFLSRESC